MKNKLCNKRFSKILVTMCLLLTMVMGSCMSVSAEVLSDTPINLYCLYNDKYYGQHYESVVGSAPVYSFIYLSPYDGSNANIVYGLVSSSSFSYKSASISGVTTLPTNFSTSSSNSSSVKYDGCTAYHVFSAINLNTDVISEADYIVTSSRKFAEVSSNLFCYLAGVYSNCPDGVTVTSSNTSGIPSDVEYDSGATATIAPPSGVTYYEYVDTSQSSATSPTVRKGQLQWNVPDDDSLYIEIYADLTYKEGLFNKKTQVVYPWKTLSNSGLKADTNKLLFDRFQAGSDYFSENGLDESAFSSHVVNGYYLRFCKVNDDKTVSYSLWNKISILRDNSLTQIGTASSETGIFDENGNWVNKQIVNSEIVDGGGKLPAFSPGLDDDGNNLPSNNNGLDLDSLLTDSNIFERFIGYLKSAMTSLGELPQYVGQLFSFLPQEIIGLLGFGVIISIILRIIGR